jgi:hypothetical protein
MKTVINQKNFPTLVARISKLTDAGLRWVFIKDFRDDEPICLPHWMYEGKDSFDEKDFYGILREETLVITEMTDMEDNVILKDDGTPILCVKRYGNLYKDSEAFTWDE